MMRERGLAHPLATKRSRCILVLAIAAAGCASNPVDVNTQLAPQAAFATYRTFQLMTPHSSGNPAEQNDPMLDNSITNQAMRSEIRQRLESLGYRPGGRDADIGVAVYAASRQALDVTNVDYGYPYRPWWWGPRERVRPITQGTVVIDVIDRRTNRLVWRGSGRGEISDNPDEYAKELRTAVDEVLKKLPRAGA
jgi:hypothetical protein